MIRHPAWRPERLTVRVRVWLPELLVGACASATAMLLQDVLRSVWQVRTLPERVEEWLLLFVPLDLFERGLAQFGANAKELALGATLWGMAAVLTVLGALLVRAGWRNWRLLAAGVSLWLLTMLVVMPVTGAGLFASALPISPVLTDAGYLVVFLGYAVLLLLGVHATRRTEPRLVPLHERRALLAGLIGAIVSSGITAFAGRQGGLATSTVPLAAIPTRLPAPQPASVAHAAAAPVEQATPTSVPLPNPPVSRALARDKDGALTAAGRPKGQLAPPITANEDFYVVTKNAVADPNVDAATWRLVIDGEVNTPVQLDYRTLLSLPSLEVTKTLECISNFTAMCNLTSFGCDLLSTARFRGVRLSDVLALAGGLKPTAVGLAVLSIDEFSAGLPAEVVDDPETLLVYQMNGEPLPREHGFPARLLVPGRYGMKNPKWLAGVRATNAEYAGWYEQRNWNKDGIVKTMSRIDTPAHGAVLAAGRQRVAGIAYAGDRGIAQVEVSVDDGASWQSANVLEPMPGKDAMVRWEASFEMPASGDLTLTVRATDGTGELQTEEFQLPQPDGASGWDSIGVTSG